MADQALLTQAEVADLLRIEEEEVSALVEQGVLGAYRFPNGHWRFSSVHIRAFLKENEMNQGTPTPTVTASGGLKAEVREFVQEVIAAENITRNPHATEHVLRAIQARWYARYDEFTTGHEKMTINQLIGRSTEELLGMENSGTRRRSNSNLAATYTVLR